MKQMTLETEFCGVLQKDKIPKDNMSIEQRRALRDLSKVQDMVILPADKGNATGVTNQESYFSKLTSMVNTTTY